MDLLLAPFLARVVLVEARQVAVVALVQRLVALDRHGFLPELVEHQVEGALGALQYRCEGDAECEAFRLQPLAGGPRLADSLLRQVDVAPAGEEVQFVPFALAVTDEYEQSVHVSSQSFERPSTSAME
jgi:hypothetical protein